MLEVNYPKLNLSRNEKDSLQRREQAIGALLNEDTLGALRDHHGYAPHHEHSPNPVDNVSRSLAWHNVTLPRQGELAGVADSRATLALSYYLALDKTGVFSVARKPEKVVQRFELDASHYIGNLLDVSMGFGDSMTEFVTLGEWMMNEDRDRTSTGDDPALAVRAVLSDVEQRTAMNVELPRDVDQICELWRSMAHYNMALARLVRAGLDFTLTMELGRAALQLFRYEHLVTKLTIAQIGAEIPDIGRQAISNTLAYLCGKPSRYE